jgi:predicted  nucleic acid-binding Zn-ribbon protein
VTRQNDRRDLSPEIRARMAEDDLDRVDVRFTELDGKIEHKANNNTMAIRGVSDRVDRLETKIEQASDKAEAEIAGNRKVMVGVLISTLSVAIAIVAQVLIMRGGS